MALVADLAPPTPGRFAPGEARGETFIASDLAPFRAQTWPLRTPIPAGWHEVSQSEAERINRATPTGLSFLIETVPSSAASEAAALTSSPPDPRRRREGRPSRTPRTPRPPRSARRARTVRPSRLFRPERPPRPPRRPRPARRPRAARKPRTRRPRNYKTTQPVGVCKGPGCTCWTPGGCVGGWYLIAIPSFTGSECYRGPCFSYELCVSEKCQLHPGCVVNTIIQFWARQYRAVAAYAVVQGPAAVAAVRRAGLRVLLPGLPPVAPAPAAAGPPPGAFTQGCGPGTYWATGLTGVRCVPFGSGAPPASAEELIAVLGFDPRTGP